MAWVTLFVDVTKTADSEESRNLLARTESKETRKLSDPTQREWRDIYFESEVQKPPVVTENSVRAENAVVPSIREILVVSR
jgi:hypothetical protein